MPTGYKIAEQDQIYHLTLQVVEWVDLFTRKSYRKEDCCQSRLLMESSVEEATIGKAGDGQEVEVNQGNGRQVGGILFSEQRTKEGLRCDNPSLAGRYAQQGVVGNIKGIKSRYYNSATGVNEQTHYGYFKDNLMSKNKLRDGLVNGIQTYGVGANSTRVKYNVFGFGGYPI